MKLNKLYLPVLSALLLASCSEGNGNEPGPDPTTLQDATITVAVTSGDGLGTRAEDPGNNAEKTLNNFAVIYAIGDEVVGYGYQVRDKVDSTACVGLKAAKDGTKYKMLVIANAGDGLIKKDGKVVDFIKAPSFSWSYYQELLVELKDQSPANSFVMTSLSQEITVKPGFNYIGKGYFEQRDGQVVDECKDKEFDNGVYVHRVAARVELYELGVSIKDDDLNAIIGLYFKLDSIFLSNVRDNSYITSDNDILENEESGYLYGGGDNTFEGEGSDIASSSEHVAFLGKPLRYGANLAFKVENGKKVDIFDKFKSDGGDKDKDPGRENGFYVMENRGVKTYPTTLYLKGSFCKGDDEIVLPNRYFRIPLDHAVERNHIYRIKATITGKGSYQPGENKDNADVEVEITLDPWIVNDFEVDPIDPTPINE